MKEPFRSAFAGLSTHHRAGVWRQDTGEDTCWVLICEYLVFSMAESDMKIWLAESRIHISASGKIKKEIQGDKKATTTGEHVGWTEMCCR